MINVSELRLGNIVKDRGGKLIRIDFFEHLENGFSCKLGQKNKISDEWGTGHPLTEYSDFAEPVGLTDTILLNAGFKELNYGWYLKQYYTDCTESSEVIEIQINLTNGRCGIADTETDGDPAMTGMEIKSLHKLQNLYFALTGEELIITSIS